MIRNPWRAQSCMGLDHSFYPQSQWDCVANILQCMRVWDFWRINGEGLTPYPPASIFLWWRRSKLTSISTCEPPQLQFAKHLLTSLPVIYGCKYTSSHLSVLWCVVSSSHVPSRPMRPCFAWAHWTQSQDVLGWRNRANKLSPGSLSVAWRNVLYLSFS
jgi:hypothetical protein